MSLSDPELKGLAKQYLDDGAGGFAEDSISSAIEQLSDDLPTKPGLKPKGRAGPTADMLGLQQAYEKVRDTVKDLDVPLGIRTLADELAKMPGKVDTEAGRKVAELVVKADDLRHMIAGRMKDTIDDAWKGMSSSDKDFVNENANALKTGRVRAPSPAVQAWVDAHTRISEELGTMKNDAGVYVLDPRTGPRDTRVSHDRFYSQRMKPELRRNLQEAMEKKGAASAKAKQTLADYVAEFGEEPQAWEIEDPSVFRTSFGPNIEPGVQRPRVKNYSDKWIMQGKEADHLWIENNAQAIAEQRVFQYMDKKTRTWRNQGQGELGPLLADLKAQQSQNGKWAADAVDYARGMRGYTTGEQALMTASDTIATGINVATLGLKAKTPLQQPSVLGNVMTIGGIRSTLPGIVKGIMRGKASYKEALRGGDVRNVLDYGSWGDAGITGNVRGGLKTVNKWTSVATAFFDAATRVVSHEAAPHALKRHQRMLNAGGKDAITAAKTLRDMYFTADEIAQIKAGKIDPELAGRYRRRFVVETNFETTKPNTNRTVSDPRFSLIFQYQKFPLSQSRFDLKHVLGPLKDGDIKPLLRKGAFTIAYGEAIGSAFEGIFGESPFRKDWDDIFKEGDWRMGIARIADDMAQVAFLGKIMSPVLEAGKRVLYGKPFQAGDLIEQQVTPPVVSVGKGMADAGGALMYGPTEDYPSPTLRALDKLFMGVSGQYREATQIYQAQFKAGVIRRLKALSGKWDADLMKEIQDRMEKEELEPISKPSMEPKTAPQAKPETGATPKKKYKIVWR